MKYLKNIAILWILGSLLMPIARAAGDLEPLLVEQAGEGDVALVDAQTLAGIYVDAKEVDLPRIAAGLLADDIERVTGRRPRVTHDATRVGEVAILIGTVGQSPVIDRLIESGKLDAADIAGTWEQFVIQTVDQPVDGVARAVVIAGSDRRGTAFGVVELSEQMGVSPWYWWADVPPQQRKQVIVKSGTYRSKPPTVRYRGIFINDEDWGLQPWAAKTFDPEFGDIGPKTYEKVFELLIRLKGNYLWPAMHKCTVEFGAVDENIILAHQWGIVMGAAHCEPLNRNNVWWHKDGKGEWRYDTNRENMLKYWEEWAAKRGKYDAVWTIGMRGIHDTGMAGPEDIGEQVKLLEQAIADQRELLRKYVNENVEEVPQVFVPYKEALTHYQNGLKLPDDVTILWSEDNYGYLRQLSTPEEQQRSGGSGVYYHISYLGWPRPYLWLNTTPPSLIWTEMSRALDFKADRIWILNVGDIKPGELGTEFWLRMAWDAERYGPDAQRVFLRQWAERDFGPEHAEEIAAIMDEFYQLGFQRKPELMDPEIFSPVYYREAEVRREAYDRIHTRATAIYEQLPQEQRDAYYQLVLYPVRISALITEAFTHADLSRLYARQGRMIAGIHADLAQAAVDRIRQETEYYNTGLAGGKWNLIMREKGISGNWTLQWPTGDRATPTPQPGLGVVVENQAIPVSAEGQYAEAGHSVDIAAVDGKYAAPWTAQRSPEGIEYLVVPNGVGDVLDPKNTPTVTYTFDVPADGRYNLFMLINCPNDKDDSWFIRINDGNWMTWNNMGTRSDWDWRRQGEYDLRAGRNTITIGQREDGAMFSRIRFTQRTSPIPLEEQFASPTPPNQLPTFDRRLGEQRRFIDLYNTGIGYFTWKAIPSADWIRLSETEGEIELSRRLWIEIDWDKAPDQRELSGEITIHGSDQSRTIVVKAINAPADEAPFVEVDGYVSIEAEQFTRATSDDPVSWIVVDSLGRTGDAVTTRPTHAPARDTLEAITTNPVTLEYDFVTERTGEVEITVYCLPTQRSHEGRGVRYAISVNDAQPQIIDFEETGGPAGEHGNRWRQNVSRNISPSTSKHTIDTPGVHTVKIWMVDPGIVVDKLVVDFGGVLPSELGPPATAVAQ